MEQIFIDNDIEVLCITAPSFPAGVAAAFEKLHSLFPPEGRTYYGLSKLGRDGAIVYKAAATPLPQDNTEGLETYTIKKGNYQAITINDYMKNTPAIGAAFQQLTAIGDIDPQGECVECYLNAHVVQCMVRTTK